MNNLMIFEGHEVEAFELKGQVLFNPYHVGECLELNGDAVRKAMSRMNEKQARRRKADFRKTLNLLLTAKIDNEEWKPVLESLGVECTLESALLMAQIKMALAGDTQAAKFVAQYSGQSARAEEDLENKKADTELIKARKEAITGENENDEALDRLDQILKEVRDNAVKQETE